MIHELKTWNQIMPDIASGKKNFEIRKQDRDFATGDFLLLKGWYPHLEKYTGEEITVEVLYIFPGGRFGIEEGYCVMGITLVKSNMDNDPDRLYTTT